MRIVNEQISKCRSMRDFTHILETEVLTALAEQGSAFADLQRSTHQMFDSVRDLQQRLSHAEDSSENRCRDSVASYLQKVKQLEDDIASMIR